MEPLAEVNDVSIQLRIKVFMCVELVTICNYLRKIYSFAVVRRCGSITFRTCNETVALG